MVDLPREIPTLADLGQAYDYTPHRFEVTEKLGVPPGERAGWLSTLQTHVAPLLETKTTTTVGQCITYNPKGGRIDAEAYDDTTMHQRRPYIPGAVRLFADIYYDVINFKLKQSTEGNEYCGVEELRVHRQSKKNAWKINAQKIGGRKNPTFGEGDMPLMELLEREVERVAREIGKDQEIVVGTCRLDELLFYLKRGYAGKAREDTELIDQILSGSGAIDLSGDVEAPGQGEEREIEHSDWFMFTKGKGCPPGRKWLDYLVEQGGEGEMVQVNLSKVFKAPEVATDVDAAIDDQEALLRAAGWIS